MIQIRVKYFHDRSSKVCSLGKVQEMATRQSPTTGQEQHIECPGTLISLLTGSAIRSLEDLSRCVQSNVQVRNQCDEESSCVVTSAWLDVRGRDRAWSLGQPAF